MHTSKPADSRTEKFSPGHSIHLRCFTRVAGGFDHKVLELERTIAVAASRCPFSDLFELFFDIANSPPPFAARRVLARPERHCGADFDGAFTRADQFGQGFARLPPFIMFGPELPRCGVSLGKENIKRRAQQEVIS